MMGVNFVLRSFLGPGPALHVVRITLTSRLHLNHCSNSEVWQPGCYRYSSIGQRYLSEVVLHLVVKCLSRPISGHFTLLSSL